MNKRTLAITFAILPTLWLAGCQTAETKPASSGTAAATKSAPQLAAEKAIASAKAAQKAAASKKNEWRDTGKIIKGAEKALKAGDFSKAEKLAANARFQGDTGVQQAAENQNAGNPGYLYQ